ncbi:AAA family ATPase [Paenibacillus dakarensis]|uniref:AAA family ATPase n=1 Tax=Paenibacillus dakarensis TaxID=1527293 RepID=UPI0006D577A7|nr:SbcC/MukB-like Walker B domain-containing protein [Paenibacillus dakarensis]
MKPVLLKLAGLQSYREPQEIDFERLCETGLFGIFGPTGSGKSTLLDAITLAMYGKVERAVNGTQGIMNHSEDSLSVSFTFELAAPAGPERYRVERRFKRVNELSVSNTISRFIAITDEGETVVADKLADVTRCVEEKIGLKMDDFTRAVVLPQGKFAEFLSLKGSERRQMLQRLFHLERYGDQLALKLSRRVKDNEGALKSVEAEQQGLGNAGREAVDGAEKTLLEAAAHAEQSRRNLQAAAERSEAMSKIRELDLEQRQLRSKLEDLSSREEEIQNYERKLELGAAAKLLVPVLDSLRESVKTQMQLSDKAEQLSNQSNQLEKTAEDACKADDTAQAALSAEEPKLLQRTEQLEQAVVLQRERDVLRRELASLDEQRTSARKSLGELNGKLQKEQELLDRGQKRQEELQQSLKQLETRAQDRQLLHDAMHKRQSVLLAEEQAAKAEVECKDQLVKQQKAEAELTETLNIEKEAQQELAKLAHEVERFRHSASEAVKFADEGAVQAASILNAMNESLREQQLHALSISLADELRDGEACPVCGSVHHPSPAQSETISSESAKKQLERFRQGQEELQELRLLLRQQLNEISSLSIHGTVREQLDTSPVDTQDNSFSNVNAEAAAGLLNELYSDLPETKLEKLKEFVSSLSTIQINQAAALLQCREKEAMLQQRLSSIQQELAKRTASSENARAYAEQLGNKLAVVKENVRVLKQSWEESNLGFGLQDIELRFKEMQERDAKAETVKDGLERSVPFLEEKKKNVSSFENQARELEKQLIQWDAQHLGKQELLQEKEERLHAWIGDRSAEELLQECRQRLMAIKSTAERSREERRKAEEAKQQAIKEAAIAKQAADSAAGHAKAAEERWLKQLRESPFASEEGVIEAFITPEESEVYTNQVQAHREGQRECSLRLKDVELKLNGGKFNEQEWQKCKEMLDQYRQADESAIQFKARAERDLEDLRKRHVRFMELEEKRLTHVTEGERLTKLQSCLRGNAFVEYIAEEQLMQVSQSASQRLRFLTKQRYSLEVDSGGGFVIRDDANGGVRRPVSTLSGGETFLTSLSLALALSAQIQLRGQYPLEFFFLDEGFGTLDPELLDTVITSLEKLHNDQLTVGIISHVPELRARLARKLVVQPAGQAGGGSQIILETL